MISYEYELWAKGRKISNIKNQSVNSKIDEALKASI